MLIESETVDGFKGFPEYSHSSTVHEVRLYDISLPVKHDAPLKDTPN